MLTVFRSIFRIAFDAIMANKLRSSLTFIGIVFGVTSVMTIISALEGMMGVVEEEFRLPRPFDLYGLQDDDGPCRKRNSGRRSSASRSSLTR